MWGIVAAPHPPTRQHPAAVAASVGQLKGFQVLLLPQWTWAAGPFLSTQAAAAAAAAAAALGMLRLSLLWAKKEASAAGNPATTAAAAAAASAAWS